MIIILPWPDKRLSPNSRTHWGNTAPVKAKHREDAATATYGAMTVGAKEVRQAFAGDGPIPCEMRFYPPDKRHRDDDNIIGSFKAQRDGIADALAVNDRRFRPVYVICEAAKPGRVEVTIYPQFTAEQARNDLPEIAESVKECGPNGAFNTSPALTSTRRNRANV